MREPVYREKNDEILDRAFEFFAHNGLENVSIRSLSESLGLSSGSIYYWFDDKDSIILESTKYGIEKMYKLLLDGIFEGMDNPDGFAEHCLGIFDKNKAEVRFLQQIASSPVYGEEIRKKSREMEYVFDDFAVRLASLFHCDVEIARPYSYLIRCVLFEYILWDDYEHFKSLVVYLCDKFSARKASLVGA